MPYEILGGLQLAGPETACWHKKNVHEENNTCQAVPQIVEEAQGPCFPCGQNIKAAYEGYPKFSFWHHLITFITFFAVGGSGTI